jgi:hypothetical protein
VRVDYTLPAGGRLQVSAEIENFGEPVDQLDPRQFRHLAQLPHDDGGLVHRHRSSRSAHGLLPQSRAASYLSTQGDDVDRSFSDLDNAVPFGVGAVSTFPIPEGETVTVLAGAHVRIDSDTDDMDAHVQATFLVAPAEADRWGDLGESHSARHRRVS